MECHAEGQTDGEEKGVAEEDQGGACSSGSPMRSGFFSVGDWAPVWVLSRGGEEVVLYLRKGFWEAISMVALAKAGIVTAILTGVIGGEEAEGGYVQTEYCDIVCLW